MESKKLKICFIGWASSIHVRRLVKWFAEQGHEVHLLSNVYYPVDGVTVHCLANKRNANGQERDSDNDKKTGFVREIFNKLKFYYLSYLKYPLYIYNARKIIKRLKPDVLQGYFIGFGGYIGVFMGVHPFMVRSGGADLLFYYKKYWWHKIMTKYVLRKVDLLIVNSDEVNRVALNMNIHPKKIRYCLLGINLKEFNPNIEVDRLKSELEIVGQPTVLCTRHLFDEYYNISNLIRAFSLVVKAIPNAKMLLVYSYGTEKGKIMKLAQELGLMKNIVWVGRKDYAEMPSYYCCADVFVSVAFVDSTPLSLLEAMACGAIPVVSDLPNLREWIKDGWNGYVVNPKNVAEIAKAITLALGDLGKSQLIKERNWKIVRDQADQEKCFRQIEEMTYNLHSEHV